ncbi:MAG: glycosyltransferase family 2 protein [Fuerstiella sp.]
MPTLSVIVPAFREAANLPELAARLLTAVSGLPHEVELIVVDDDSDDGTAEVCEQLAEVFPLRLITRKNERGLATAVIAGLKEARGDYCVVMDADLSHPPEAVPHLLEPLQKSAADFVIGSRYVAGGSIDESWSLRRHLNSRIATLLAAGLTRARDPMAGFFAFRRSCLVRAPVLNPCGYKIGLEILVRCRCAHVVEVPICFQDRKHGHSKLTLREQWLYLRHLSRLYRFRYPELFRIAAFGAVGASGLMLDVFSFQWLIPIAGLAVGRAMAIWMAMSWNFELNRRITFSETTGAGVPAQYLRYCASCLVGAALSWSTSLTLIRSSEILQRHTSLVVVAGAGVAAVVNYMLCRVWVFRRRWSWPRASVR